MAKRSPIRCRPQPGSFVFCTLVGHAYSQQVDSDDCVEPASPPPRQKPRVNPPALALAAPSNPKALLTVQDVKYLKQVLSGLGLPADARQQLEHNFTSLQKAIKEYSVNSQNVLKDVAFAHLTDPSKSTELVKCAEFAKELQQLQSQVDRQ